MKENTHDQMKDQNIFRKMKRLDWQSLIKFFRLLKKLKQEELFEPILNREENCADWIKQGYSSGVHEANEQYTESVG